MLRWIVSLSVLEYSNILVLSTEIWRRLNLASWLTRLASLGVQISAVSASVEIIKELSSSFADTASVAQSGTGSFSGSFTGSGEFDIVSASQDIVVSGNVFVDGTLDAATKNFRIDHPTMEGYYLIHSSLEGPERGIYYRGK